MQLLKFKIIYSFLWLISKLPWPIFYLLSDFVYFILYRIIRYRRKVVTSNLKLAFPHKSHSEIKAIRKKFYTHMCDMFLEMVKSITISQEETLKRYHFKNLEVLHKLNKEKKSLVILAAHYANYEWGNCLDLLTDHKLVGIYKAVKNKHLNNFAKKIRGRFGSEVIENKKIMRYAISKERSEPGQRIYGFIGDQSPRSKKDAVFIPFMGHEVPAFVGGEFLAKKLNMAIAYHKVKKVKRGFYEIEIVLISEDLSKNNHHEATRTYFKMLENQINENPEFYLWTHKRWKHVD